MKKGYRPVQGRTVWVLLVFMTILLGFPFLFYYKYSTTGKDLLKSIHLYAGDFGGSLSRYFEGMSMDDKEAVSRGTKEVPLIAGARIELYDREGLLIAEQSHPLLEYDAGHSSLYEGIKRVIDTLRQRKHRGDPADWEQIKEKLLERSMEGKRGADYAFASGYIGDRILFFSYPLRDYSQGNRTVKGVLLMEYRDSTAGAILQKQRNQFAAACLIFGILLVCHVIYIITMLMIPLRRIIRKTRAIQNGTEYLLPNNGDFHEKNEMGELLRHLDGIKKNIDSRDREMEQHLSEIRHILRNPLSNMKAALEGLMLEKRSENDILFFRIIQKNLMRIDKYISIHNPVLAYTSREPFSESLYLDTFLEKIIQDFYYLAKKKNIRIELIKPEKPIEWHGSQTLLEYACEQILSNAVDFSPRSGIITIELSSGTKETMIRITDQGPGIPSGKEEEIFRQYVSFRSTLEREHTGTGLFLSMNALRKIGGNLYAENKDREGAVFTVTLPNQV